MSDAKPFEQNEIDAIVREERDFKGDACYAICNVARFVATIDALRARAEQAEAELSSIDYILARRPANPRTVPIRGDGIRQSPRREERTEAMMTAAQIAEVVGTERQPWWPADIRWDEHEQDFYSDHLKRRPSDALTELAFIGAAAVEMAKRNRHTHRILEIWHCGDHWHARTSEHSAHLLGALVAAIKESEASQ